MVLPVTLVGEGAIPELQMLAGEAVALDGRAAPIDPAVPSVPIVDYAAEAAGLIAMGADSLTAIYPAIVIASETRARLAGAWAPVFEKYGWTGGELFGKYSAELGAAIVTVPILLKVVAAVRAQPKAKVAPKEAEPGDTSIVSPLPATPGISP